VVGQTILEVLFRQATELAVSVANQDHTARSWTSFVATNMMRFNSGGITLGSNAIYNLSGT